MIVIEIVPLGAGRYSASVDGAEIVASSRQPFLDAARALLARGTAVGEPIVMRRRGVAADALRSQVSIAAGLRAKEPGTGRISFVRWRSNDWAHSGVE